MESPNLDCLLGEFKSYLYESCNFSRIVKWNLINAEGHLYNGNLERAKIHYDRLIGYIEAVKARQDIRERELSKISDSELHRSNVGSETDLIIQEYISGLNS